MSIRRESPSDSKGETLLIRGVEIAVHTKSIQQHTLNFFVDNPRIYSVLHGDGKEKPSQEEIERELLKLDHVKALVQDIKLNGGLTDPVVVRDGSFEVLEGNSRLAAYRHLAKLDPVKWSMIRAKILPNDTDEKLIFALLGQYHITGKKDWSPFEQAGFLYRRHKNHQVESQQLAQELGLSTQKINHLIKIYEFMLQNGQGQSRWSYYDEYFKSRIIQNVADDKMNELIVEKINSNEIEKAVYIREKLPKIVKVPNALKKFKAERVDFERAYDIAVDSGADSTPYMKLKRFRNWLATLEAADSLGRTGGETRNKVVYELKKLKTNADQLLKALSRQD